MTITQETANLVDTLAHAASQIGSTAASARINQLIVDILPTQERNSAESIAEALRQDNLALKNELLGLNISARTMAENLELLRGKLAEIHEIASVQKSKIDSMEDHADSIGALEDIINLAAPVEA